jgi:hypothetical protein
MSPTVGASRTNGTRDHDRSRPVAERDVATGVAEVERTHHATGSANGAGAGKVGTGSWERSPEQDAGE